MTEETGSREQPSFFFFLHPKIGAKNSAETSAFTSANENTLLFWLYQKNDCGVVGFS
jgi:hypothetical protein